MANIQEAHNAISPVVTSGYGNKSVGTSAVQLFASSQEVVRLVRIKPSSSNSGVIYVGFDNSVTTSNGFPLGDEGEIFQIKDLSDVYLISDTTSQEVRYYYE